MAFDSYTKALLHFNGTDGSTTFTDEIGKTWTAHGSAQLDTAQAKFGESSLLSASGSTNYIDTPDSTDFVLGSSDFTMDCWIRMSSLASGVIASRGDIVFKFYLSYGIDMHLEFRVFDGTDDVIISHSASLSINTWYHVAVVMSSSQATLYVDGVGNAPTYIYQIYNSAAVFKVGVGLVGWVDEFRFCKGIARWTSNFNPPTAPYTDATFIPQVMVIGE